MELDDDIVDERDLLLDAEGARRQAADVLGAIMRYRNLSAAELGLLVGLSRQTVWSYLSGNTRLEVGIMRDFSTALRINPLVFHLEPDQALQYAIRHAPNPPTRPAQGRRKGPGQRNRGSSWVTVSDLLQPQRLPLRIVLPLAS